MEDRTVSFVSFDTWSLPTVAVIMIVSAGDHCQSPVRPMADLTTIE